MNHHALVTGAKLIAQASDSAEALRRLWGAEYDVEMADFRGGIRVIAQDLGETPGHPKVILEVLKRLQQLDALHTSASWLAAWWWFAHEGGL